MAYQKDFTIDQNTDYTVDMVVNDLTNPDLPFDATTNPYIPVDITGYTIELTAAVDYETTPILALSTTSGDITITNGPQGKARIKFVPSHTADVYFGSDNTVAQWEGVYDIYMTSAGSAPESTRLFYGAFYINREVA